MHAFFAFSILTQRLMFIMMDVGDDKDENVLGNDENILGRDQSPLGVGVGC